MKTNLNVTYVYVINSDVKMTKGKVAAQVSHCAMLLHDKYPDLLLGRALILKARYAELIWIFYNAKCVQQVDAGRNQVQRGTLTCIAFEQNVHNKHITQGLKLY